MIREHLGRMSYAVAALLLSTIPFEPVADARSASAMELVPLSEVTHTAVVSGPWSEATTWGGTPPGEDARLRIPPGIEVTVDGSIGTRYRSLRLEGGLVFDRSVDTGLRIGTLVGLAGSGLVIGDSQDPIPSNRRATLSFPDFGPIDRSADPSMLGRGVISMGSVSMHGSARRPFTSVDPHPVAGDTVLRLAEDPTGWRVGDRIVVAGVDPLDPATDEVRTVVSIAGRSVEVDRPLARSHAAPSPDLEVHVANLSRNVLVRSEASTVGRRGHVMFMHTHEVDCRHVRFERLGRTDKRRRLDDWSFPNLDAELAEPGPGLNPRGRYAVHFHRGGVDPSATRPARIEGCVAEDNPGWAYVNHSSNVDFVGNVSYDVVGGAFQTESGDKIGSFIDNIAIRTVNPDRPILSPETEAVDIREDVQDFAFQGDGFWLHGGGVAVDGNVASGCSGHGFIYWTEGLREVGTPFDYQNMFLVSNVPDGDLLPGVEQIGSWFVPLRSFRGNRTYSAAKGLALYYVHTTQFDDITTLTDDYVERMHSTFEDFHAWNVELDGIELQNSERMTFRDVRIHNQGHTDATGIRPWPTVSNRTVWENVSIRGFDRGMVVPMQGDVTIRGGTMANEVDYLLIPPQKDSNEPASDRDLLVDGVLFDADPAFDPSARIHFQMLGGEALRGEIPILNPEDAVLLAMIPDRIRIETSAFSGRLYYEEQAAGYRPITAENVWDAVGDYRREVLNRTNAQIRQSIGLCFAGELLPSDAIAVPGVAGGRLGPATGSAMSVPNCLFINEPPLPPDFFDDFDFYDCWDANPPVASNVPPFDHGPGEIECRGDVNGDGTVDAFDLGLLIAAWGGATAAADLDDDGVVGAADLGLLIAAWGACV